MRQRSINIEKESPMTPKKKGPCAVTFYLPDDLLDRLDETWMSLRRSDRSIKKSHLVRTFIENGLKKYEGKKLAS